MLAVLLWFAVTSDKEYTHIIEVPLEIKTLGENLVLVNLPPKTVKIRVKGSGRSLFGLNFIDKEIGLEFPEISTSQVIDLQEYKGRFQFPQDLGIEIVDIIYPKKLNLVVDTFYEKHVPVKVENDIKTVPGYLLVDYKTETDTVLVSGPKGLVEKIDFIKTEVVKNRDVRFPFDVVANLVSPNPGVISIMPGETKISFRIEQLVERTIYNIPIKIINVPPNINAEATPTTISLRVKGGETRISGLRARDINVIFDYAVSFESGKTQYPMQIETPIGVSWLDASPQNFNLKLIRKEASL